VFEGVPSRVHHQAGDKALPTKHSSSTVHSMDFTWGISVGNNYRRGSHLAPHNLLLVRLVKDQAPRCVSCKDFSECIRNGLFLTKDVDF
jgi:hypothetical protein